ncbi:MAG: hypothetical protein R3B93_14875 [Bacteroidia bacterium]
MADFSPSMNPENRSYLNNLQKQVNTFQAVANAARAHADAIKSEENFEKAYLDQANKELATATAYYQDAQNAFAKTQTLQEFLKNQYNQTKEVYKMAQDTASKVFQAAYALNDCAQVSEACFNMAKAWNTSLANNPDGNEIPYTQTAFMDVFTEIDAGAQVSFRAALKASESAFSSSDCCSKTKHG